MPRSWVLVVAGHDSSGGAGVDADREALEAAGVGAEVVVTAWTKQDASGVRELGAVEPSRWLEQALGALARRPAAIKIGLLPGADALAGALELCDAVPAGLPVVLDPVIAASSGRRFLGPEEVGVLRQSLLSRGVILTPNLPEAAQLCDVAESELLGLEARVAAARELIERGCSGVLLKGGHADEDPLRDLVSSAGGVESWVVHARIAGDGIRGSGCRYASAVAGCLARGAGLEEAARWAANWVGERIALG